ncbi:MAG: TetR family transcriptional regulator [Acidimicrobiia bacterium]|nr:TetR family transcriptional regulator [Acidimicrobiia bacterium]
MDSTTVSTRDRIIGAAEELFASRGVAGVSLREINRESGAKSPSAVQYHFENRAGVLRAILEKHRPAIESARHAVLDHCEAEGTLGLRDLAGALVRPLAAKLSDPDGGPNYLQINAELVNKPRPLVDPAPGDPADSVQRWRALVEPLLDPDAVVLHRRFTAIRFTAVELGRRAATAPHTDDRLFVHQLIDLTAALLSAPLSDETRRLAVERPRPTL